MALTRLHVWGLTLLALPQLAAAQTTVSVTSDRDNTLYSNPSGSLSNGAGTRMFVGRTNTGAARRGILHFDLSAIPSSAVVTDARLEMSVIFSSNMTTGSAPHSLFRVSQDWGEGTTLAGSGEGSGGPATAGSATWVHTFFSGSNWVTNGGDFSSTASDTQSAPLMGPVDFQSASVTADVQAFVSDAAANFGWIIKADDETTGGRVYGTREGFAVDRPTLVVTFDMPLGSSICGPAVPNQLGLSGVMSASGSSAAADNDLTLTASQLPLQVFGFFITSETQGFTANPGGSFGNICLGGTLGRFQIQIQNTGTTGEFSIPVDLTAIPGPTGTIAVMPGDTYFFQAWHRDSQSGASGSNFTDGYQISFN